MSGILIESQYFPSIQYFSTITDFDEVIVEKYEHYQKQTFRNRCYINTAQGSQALIVPVVHGSAKIPIKDLRIDYRQKWVANHWRTLQSAYGKAPFFEYYSSGFHDLLLQKPPFLYDLNRAILALCLKYLKCNISVRETTTYEAVPGIGIKDFRSGLNPKKADSCNSSFKTANYQQVFGVKFVDNLSILDLVFCEGPGAWRVIRESAVLNK